MALKYFKRREHALNCSNSVSFRDPSTHQFIVKRILALEGDTVETLPPYPDRRVKVPEGHAWVEGMLGG